MTMLRLRQIREERRLSQGDLADLCLVDKSDISHWETGRREPSLANLVRLAMGLGCTVDYLISSNELACDTLKPSKDEYEMLRRFRLLSQENRMNIVSMINIMTVKD